MKITDYDHRQTNIAKGVALLMLLWHHLFYNNPDTFNRFISLWVVNGTAYNTPIESYLADFCKVCVAVFLLLSGFGLFKSYRSWQRNLNCPQMTLKEDAQFVWHHLSKLFLDYWYIYIIFVPLGLIFNKPLNLVYEENLLYGIVDFLGLSHIFVTPTMNATWWFMGIIIVYYLLFPVLMKIVNYSAELFIALCILFHFSTFLPEFQHVRTYLLPFAVGMYLAKYNWLERIKNAHTSVAKSAILCIVLILGAIIVRYYNGHKTTYDAFFAFAVILFSYLLLSRVPLISTILQELGKYSGSIFMFHTFLYSYYFQKIVFSPRYSIVIFVLFTLACYIIAKLLEYTKDSVKYRKLYPMLSRK